MGTFGRKIDDGHRAQDEGRLRAARGFFEEALAEARAEGDAGHLVSALGELFATAKAQGDLEAARHALEEALRLERERGTTGAKLATWLLRRGDLAEEEGDAETALRCFEEAEGLDPARAKERLARARDQREQKRFTHDAADALRAEHAGDAGAREAAWRKALEDARGVSSQHEGEARLALALALAALGREAEAEPELEALAALRDPRATPGTFSEVLARHESYWRGEEREEAYRVLERAAVEALRYGGEFHLDAGLYLRKLAERLEAEKRLAEAWLALRFSERFHHPPEKPAAVDFERSVRLLRALERHAEADAYARRELEATDAAEHPSLWRARAAALAYSLHARGEHAACLELARRVASQDAQREAKEGATLNQGRTLSLVAASLFALGDAAGAREALREMLAVLWRVKGLDREELRWGYGELEKVCLAQGDAEGAAEARAGAQSAGGGA